MEWIDINVKQPIIEGKYLVKTRTMMGNTQRLEAHCTISNGKASFSVSNQIVTHWIKE